MAKKEQQKRHEKLSKAFEKMDSEIAEVVLQDNLHGNNNKATGEGGSESEVQVPRPLNFYSTDPKEEGHLRHFLRQLAKLCHLRGDMIPRAQESLLQKFFLSRRDRHHLQQMSHAHALRSEEALGHGNARLALLERLEAWRKMPRDFSLLLDVVEAYIEPDSFIKERGTLPDAPVAEPQKATSKTTKTSKHNRNNRLGLRGAGGVAKWRFGTLWHAKKSTRQQEKKNRQILRKQQEKTARQLFQLSPQQYRRHSLNYLKKSVELFIGLEYEGGPKNLTHELVRLQKLQQNYPRINWQRYIAGIRALRGRPRKRWPWVLLFLLVLTSLLAAIIYLPWRRWFMVPKAAVGPSELPQFSEQDLLDSPVPVEWLLPPERDRNFQKVIEKSRRLRLNQHYVYEVQGRIMVKSTPSAKADDANELEESWQHLRPTEPFDLLLIYESKGERREKRLEFSYNNKVAASDVNRAPIMEGDTVLFSEVFRLPGRPANGDRLLASIAKVGAAPPSSILLLNKGGFAQHLNSVDIQDKLVPTVAMAFRAKVMRRDGEKIRLLGYDIELQNNNRQALKHYELRLNWRQEDGIRPQNNSPLLLQRDYSIVADSGTNLPGYSRTTQRLWLEVPEDLNYPIEKLTPQVRILKNSFVASD